MYDSAATKVEAFRKRQEAAGLMRKEILLERRTNFAVQALVDAHGASAGDVSSALFAFGLSEYLRRYAPTIAAQMDAASAEACDQGVQTGAPAEDEDPIVAFIRARQRLLE